MERKADALVHSEQSGHQLNTGAEGILGTDLCTLAEATRKRFRICLLGLKCYELLASVPNPRVVGGSERQLVFVARGLARRGHRVSLVTLEGANAVSRHDGIRVLTAYRPDNGLPGLRFFHPRWTGLARALRDADADIYYQMGADSETGQLAAWCRARHRRFVFATASDADCDPALPQLPSVRQRALFRYGLSRADAVVSQTRSQREMLRNGFGVESTVVSSCSADVTLGDDVYRARTKNPRPHVLWVGRLVKVKRVELLLELAATRPDWHFCIVGSGDQGDSYVRKLHTRAISLANVTIRFGLGAEELESEYRRANVLVCCSRWEGVPNVFLEAWARGLPVVSTVDPDGVITSGGLGVHAPAAGLADAIAEVLSVRADTWKRSRDYFLRTHTIDASVSALQQIFESFALRPDRRGL